MSRAQNFIDADLSSRAAGFAGVFASLIAAGALTDYSFLTMPQHEYPPLQLEILPVSMPNIGDSHLNAGSVVPQPEAEQPAPEPPSPPPRAEQPPPQAAHPLRTAEKPASRSETLRTNGGNAVKAVKPSHTQAEADRPRSRTQPEPALKSGAGHEAAVSADAEATARAAQQKARQLVTGLILDQIRSSMVYPQRAVQRQLQGTVVMEFTIKGGIITSFRIARGSGHAILDSAASRLGEQLIGFNTRNDQHSLTLNVPIKYALIR